MSDQDKTKRRRSAQSETPDVAAAIAQLGAEAAHVALWRLPENGTGEPKYLGRLPAEGFMIDQVQERFGGGRYRARVANQQNVFVTGGTHTFSIDGKPKTPGDDAAASANGAHANGTGPSLAEKLLLATVPAVVAALAKKLLEPKEADPILLELLKSRAGRGEGVSAIELANLLETTRANTRTELLELLGEREPREPTPSSWADVVRDSLPPLIEVMRTEQRREAPPRARATATVSAPPPSTSAAEAGAGDPVSAPNWIARIRPFVPMALRLADQHKNPQVQAAAMLDTVSEAVADEIGSASLAPTFVDDVFRQIPEFCSTPARREWFTAFLQAVAECFEPEGDDAPPAAERHASDAAAVAGAPTDE